MKTDWNTNYITWSKLVATYGADSSQAQNPSDPQAFIWLNNQKALRRAGKLGSQEEATLAREGIDWDYGYVPETAKTKKARKKSKPSKAWTEKVNALLAEVTNRSWVEIRQSCDEFALLCTQIGTAKKKNKLSQSLIEALNVEAFIWDWQGYKKGLAFDARIVELEDIKSVYGDANLSRKLAKQIGKLELFNWQVNIRTAARRGKITQAQIMRLKGLGVWFDKGDGSFHDLHDEMESWFEVNGHSNLPTSHPLYPAQALLRREYRNDALSPIKKAMLDKLDFDPNWKAGEASIQARVNGIIAYHDDHGSFEGLQHAGHVKTQVRQDYLHDRLTDDQIAALESRGFEWSERKVRESVPEKVMRLLKFYREHGHMYVPYDHELGAAVNNLRTKYNRDEMPEQDVALLNAIGFPWDGRSGAAVRRKAA